MVDRDGIESVESVGGFLGVIAVMSAILIVGLYFFRGDLTKASEIAITELEAVSVVADSEMKDKDLSLVLASYPNMVNYTSNKTTKGNPNDYFIETEDGKIHYIEINRYWFREPDLTTNDLETIKEGTILYDQYEESLAIIEGLQE